MIGLLKSIAERFGTPCYVYLMDRIDRRVERLRRAFGGRFQISYAVKSNPNPALIGRLRNRVEKLDISSGGELRAALRAGWPAERLSFTGPAKSLHELQAVSHRIGAVIVESLPEAETLNRLAARTGRRRRVLVRIAPMKLPPGFGVGMAGRPTQFGVDEEALDATLPALKQLAHLRIAGLHAYCGSQCLDADSLVENFDNVLQLFRRTAERHDLRPDELIFGSSLGVPYYQTDEPVDLEAVAREVNPLLDRLGEDPRFAGCSRVLELGRYLVGEAGLFLTGVVAKKHSRGVEICVCDGGMNNHLAACGHLGSVIHRNFRMFKVALDLPDAPRKYDLFGPLCTSIDTLGRDVEFAGLDVGDVIAVQSSGAYGLTASPIHFISHDPPREVLVRMVAGKSVVEDVSQFAQTAARFPLAS